MLYVFGLAPTKHVYWLTILGKNAVCLVLDKYLREATICMKSHQHLPFIVTVLSYINTAENPQRHIRQNTFHFLFFVFG